MKYYNPTHVVLTESPLALLEFIIMFVNFFFDDEFKKFMGNPSIEAAIKLENKRADRKLKELDRERRSDNPIVGFFNQLVRDNLSREKQRLEKAAESFKALDLNKVKTLFFLIE